MPRKSSPKGEVEPVVRRVSARIAAAPKPPPPALEKTSSRTPKRGASQKATEELKKTLDEDEQPEKSLEASTEVNGDPTLDKEPIMDKSNEDQFNKDNQSNESTPDEPVQKKSKIDEPSAENEKTSNPDISLSQTKQSSDSMVPKILTVCESQDKTELIPTSTPSETIPPVELNVSSQKVDVPDESEFVVIKPTEVPKPNDKEVKEAIDAQGEDGSLLVGFVQIPKDEVLSHDSEDVQKIASNITKSLESLHNNGTSDHVMNGTETKTIDESPVTENKLPVDSSGDEPKEAKNDPSLIIDDVEIAANGTS